MELELYSLGLDDKLFPGFYGISEKEDIKFLKLEYIEGYELTEHTQLNNLFSVEKIIDILMHLASTLSYLHDRDIIYADMKDKNVICENECEKVRLLDLGMASNKIRVEKETGEKFVYEIVSNAEYACPETITSSKVYKKSDVFQLGILAYKLVTGEHPFAEGIATQDYLEKGAELIAFSLANLWNNANLDNFFFEDTPELGNLVSDMLKKDYSQRPDSISVVSRLQTIKEKYYGGKTK